MALLIFLPSRGLDPRVQPFGKKMDCRVISAFTRVFDAAAQPGSDEAESVTL
jgi:hypothetical protein